LAIELALLALQRGSKVLRILRRKAQRQALVLIAADAYCQHVEFGFHGERLASPTPVQTDRGRFTGAMAGLRPDRHRAIMRPQGDLQLLCLAVFRRAVFPRDLVTAILGYRPTID